jgi:alkaline phosphatase D
MTTITRRSFMEMAVALGAAAAWGQPTAARSRIPWHERRDFYPQGVASGDPESDSVLLWTRRPPKDGDMVKKVSLEIAEDEAFTRVVASASANVSEETDWTPGSGG